MTEEKLKEADRLLREKAIEIRDIIRKADVNLPNLVYNVVDPHKNSYYTTMDYHRLPEAFAPGMTQADAAFDYLIGKAMNMGSITDALKIAAEEG